MSSSPLSSLKLVIALAVGVNSARGGMKREKCTRASRGGSAGWYDNEHSEPESAPGSVQMGNASVTCREYARK